MKGLRAAADYQSKPDEGDRGQWLWWCMTDQRSSLLIPETRRDTSVEAETSGGG
jgi:hypothetical protein